MANNYWWNFGAGNSLEGVAKQDFVRSHLVANANTIADPQLRNVSRTNDGMLDPRPADGSPALTAAAAPVDAWFTAVPYVGAFGDGNWAKGWSFLSTGGVLGVRVAFDARIPSTVELGQNYPNPFNPSTTIRFALPIASHARLAVYDMYGRQVDELLNGHHDAGTHTVTWTPKSLPSGTYFYLLQSGTDMQMKKMTLVK